MVRDICVDFPINTLNGEGEMLMATTGTVFVGTVLISAPDKQPAPELEILIVPSHTTFRNGPCYTFIGIIHGDISNA
ncbi:MAG: hypothetical protein ABIS36_10960 [Chryseolinea sp.]